MFVCNTEGICLVVIFAVKQQSLDGEIILPQFPGILLNDMSQVFGVTIQPQRGGLFNNDLLVRYTAKAAQTHGALNDCCLYL